MKYSRLRIQRFGCGGDFHKKWLDGVRINLTIQQHAVAAHDSQEIRSRRHVTTGPIMITFSKLRLRNSGDLRT